MLIRLKMTYLFSKGKESLSFIEFQMSLAFFAINKPIRSQVT